MLASQSTLPTIEVNFTPSIVIQTESSNVEAISESLVMALRNMTPELQQQLQDTMGDLFNNGEYIEA
ncbi:hypothetical protein AT251_07890 [Enterovibrio nigricans]|nr:hypothetical protein [Enterovibrio nigricans]PKF50926.1 hypothetical protein AT251_07890 [Enterovibrio nigricans]